MAAPLLQNFATIVSNQIASIQTAASALVSFSKGSILRAIVNSNAAVGLWLQGLSLQTMALTRFSSSFGSDADTWGKDWGFYRLAAVKAGGPVTFSRYTATTTALVPVGAIVQTADKTQQFAVVADATNPAYDGVSGYVIPANTASLGVPVQATVGGFAGNVIAGSISLMVTSIQGIDYVNNALNLAGGMDAESDAAFKSRFPNFLALLARATPAALTAAIQAIQPGAQVQILENVTYNGALQPGFLTIIVDDGTGAPSPSFLAAAAAAIEKYRAAGVQFGLYGPTITNVAITYTITTAAGYDHSALATASQNAVLAYIDALLDGASLPWSAVWGVIYNTSPGITNVTNLLINGATADIVPAHVYNVIKVTSVTAT